MGVVYGCSLCLGYSIADLLLFKLGKAFGHVSLSLIMPISYLQCYYVNFFFFTYIQCCPGGRIFMRLDLLCSRESAYGYFFHISLLIPIGVPSIGIGHLNNFSN